MKSGGPLYRFGPFVLIPSEHELLRNGKRVHLARRDFELLVALIEQAGHLLRKEDLQQRLWPRTVVEEGNLTKHVSTLRKALGDTDGVGRLIETVPRVGVRFIAPVIRVEGAENPVMAEAPPAQRTPRWGILAAAALVIAAAAALALTLSRSPEADPGSHRWSAIAVLPFTTLGGDDSERFGLGLADGIITRLSGQPLVPVRPTSAVRIFAGAPRPAPSDIGRVLNVDVILEGHVQRSGERVRVTVQLTDVRAASPVWGETFDEPVAEVFQLEDAIAERVAAALRLRLAAAEQQRLRRRYTENAAAYSSYLAGREQLLQYTAEGARNAVAHFERALTLDPGYALARAGLAMASADMYLRFARESELQEWGERAEREALAALAQDPNLAEAHLARAAVYRKREFDWRETVAASRRALVLNPNLAQARYFIAAALYHQGLMPEALAEMERGRQIGEPDLVEPLRIEGLVALFSGDFRHAQQKLEQLREHSGSEIGDTYLALSYYYLGEGARARAMLEELARETSASTAARSRVTLAILLATAGDSQRARGLLDAVLAADYRDHHVAYGTGAALAQLGEPAAAIEWLRRAADTGFPCVVWYERDPLLGVLREEPSFRALLADLAARREAAAARLAPQ